MTVTKDTPIAMLTVGQLQAVLGIDNSHQEEAEAAPSEPKRYVYGLAGIRNLFNVSHATAQKYKDGILADAVHQNGRKIMVDVDKAIELFSKENRSKK